MDWVLCSAGTERRVAAWSEVAAGVVPLPVEAGVLFTAPVADLRVSLPWLAAGRESLLLCTEVVDLRLSPLCPASSLPDDLLPVAAVLLLSLPEPAAGRVELPRLPCVLV